MTLTITKLRRAAKMLTNNANRPPKPLVLTQAQHDYFLSRAAADMLPSHIAIIPDKFPQSNPAVAQATLEPSHDDSATPLDPSNSAT